MTRRKPPADGVPVLRSRGQPREILDSRYAKATIRTDGGRAQVEVRTATDQRTVTYGTAEDLQDGLELEGVNAFLTAQDRDAESVLHATVEAMWANETTTVIEVHPEPLKHTPVEASPIEWEPSGLATAANPTDGAETQHGQGAEHTNQPDRRSGPRAERSELQ